MKASITIAVSCYNGAPFIGRTIECLLAQTEPAEEVIVVDDGSTDHTAEIVRQYPVKLIQHPENLGLSVGRNTLWQAARTDWIVYIDADAFAEPRMLAALAQVIDQNAMDGVGGRGIEAVQDTLFDRWRCRHAIQGHGEKAHKVEHLFGLCMAYRRSVLAMVGGFDIRLRTNAEDLDMGYRLTDAGFQLSYMPEAIVYHQRRDTHASLVKMMHTWYYWAFLVKKKNKRNPWTLAAGTLKRMLWKDTLSDLLVQRDWGLAKLDLELSLVKLRALGQANKQAKDYNW